MLGARMHYAVPVILERAGLLRDFYTDISMKNKPWAERWFRIFPKNHWPTPLQRLYDRAIDDIPAEKIISFDFLGMWYWWKRRYVRSANDLITLYARAGQAFGERVVGHGLSGATVVYGFNGASLEIFRYAKQRGITCIQEQTLAPRKIEKELLNEEIIHWTGWQPGLTLEDEASSDPLAEREEAEWALADRIICGSAFVAEGLQSLGVKSKKCHVVPYGVDLQYFRPMAKSISRTPKCRSAISAQSCKPSSVKKKTRGFLCAATKPSIMAR